MPRIERSAEAVWEGNLARGAGALTGASSGAFSALPYRLATRASPAPHRFAETLGELAQPARAHVVDEAGRGERIGQQLRLGDAAHARADGFVHVGEGQEVRVAGVDAELRPQPRPELLVRE